uniref:porin n=1 Tax=Glaesserella sp. TaxID=2094731 RepID=UPI00359F6709
LDARSSNNVQLLHKDEKFSDASRLAFGISYDINDAFILRAGIAFDESASVEKPSISIPDTDRTWYALGATYRFTPNLSVDVAYAHLRGSKMSFTEAETTSLGTVSGSFKSKSTANLYGLNLNYKF